MAKISDKTKVSIRLADGDREELQKFYPSIPYNKVIRTLVHRHVVGLNRKLDTLVSKDELPDAGEF